MIRTSWRDPVHLLHDAEHWRGGQVCTNLHGGRHGRKRSLQSQSLGDVLGDPLIDIGQLFDHALAHRHNLAASASEPCVTPVQRRRSPGSRWPRAGGPHASPHQAISVITRLAESGQAVRPKTVPPHRTQSHSAQSSAPWRAAPHRVPGPRSSLARCWRRN